MRTDKIQNLGLVEYGLRLIAAESLQLPHLVLGVRYGSSFLLATYDTVSKRTAAEQCCLPTRDRQLYKTLVLIFQLVFDTVCHN